MGRGPFFGSSRKMRGFPMNLSPGGLEEGPPGFPYFATADGKFEFGYGPPFHHDAPFFHPPPAMPFNQPGWYSSNSELITNIIIILLSLFSRVKAARLIFYQSSSLTFTSPISCVTHKYIFFKFDLFLSIF
jgi:hypothetical protein